MYEGPYLGGDDDFSDEGDDEQLPPPPDNSGLWTWDADAGEWVILDEPEPDESEDRGDDLPAYWDDDLPDDWYDLLDEGGYEYEEFEIGIDYGEDT